jgi:transcriptional regulator GlxA family with amidase domain
MRVFKQRMKMTPYAFVEQVRMFHAIDALRRTATSVAEIAIDCGFYDPSSFVKRFRRFTGLTPLAYRRQQQDRTRPALAIPRVGS